jgi:anaerobic selenocysteine-containing dehydrogenase
LHTFNITFSDLQREHLIYIAPGVGFHKYLSKGFKTPSGKIELYSERLREHNQDPIPLFQTFRESRELIEEYPMVGTTRRPGNYVHTRFRDINTLRKSQPDPLLRMHPRDAESRKLADGELATIKSPEGEISIKTRITDEIGPGVVVVDFGWGNPWDGGPNVNILTSDQTRCSISGATPNRRFRCRVTKSQVSFSL